MTSRFRTILVCGSYAPSLIVFRGQLISALVEQGYRVVATSPDISPVVASQIAALGAIPVSVPLSRTGLDPLADLSYSRGILALIREYAAAAVLSYTIKPNIWCSLAARLGGIPSVAMVTGLGYAFTEARARRSVRRRLVRQLARILYRQATYRNARVIFQNQDDVADFVKAGCLSDRSKVRMVAGSGVDLDHFAFCPLPEGFHFLMIARLLKNKGVQEFGEAAVRLLRERSDLTFDLVGYPDEGPDGLDPAALEGWESAGLRFHGYQADVRPFLRACSVYVLPSYREGMPRSVLEAMATGRPIVTTDAPGCRETVREGENGMLVPVGNVEALTTALRAMATDSGRLAAMGEASRRLAEERFDVDRVNQAIISILEEVL